MAKIEVMGDKRILKKFAQLTTKAAQRRVINKAARPAAKPILESARANAPVETGALRRSIKIRTFKTRPGMSVAPGTREELGIPAEAKHYYPAAVEYGHSGAPGKFFMRRAFETQKASSMQAYRSGVVLHLEAEAKRK